MKTFRDRTVCYLGLPQDNTEKKSMNKNKIGHELLIAEARRQFHENSL